MAKALRPKGNAPTAQGNVGFVRDEIRVIATQYQKIRDCIAGETAVKDAGDKYLPRPDPLNTSDANIARYSAYVTRAVFYNATRRTLAGLLGEVFAVDPIIELPTALEPMKIDATGSSISLVQQASQCCNFVLSFSRSGLFVDFPAVDGPLSQQQVQSGQINPTITVYDPEKIINWRTITRGSRILLSLVVIEEMVDKNDDGFQVRQEKQWRVLRLDGEGLYQVEIWPASGPQSNLPGGGTVQIFKPADRNGNRFDEIPFHFVGATSNDTIVEQPLFYDLASLNIAHYRNSADFEESSFTVGQPTYVFTGLTKDWVNTVLGGRLETGSRRAVPLPANATADILQPDPNTLPSAGMEHKERQMVALGAKLVENRSVQRTASEATMDQRTENSILATAATNVSNAFQWALEWSAKFIGIGKDGIKFELNKDFAVAKLSPEDQQQLVATWQANGITTEEMRAGLRKSGIATETDEKAIPKLKKQADEASARKAAEAKASRPPTNAVQPASRTPKKPAAKKAA